MSGFMQKDIRRTSFCTRVDGKVGVYQDEQNDAVLLTPDQMDALTNFWVDNRNRMRLLWNSGFTYESK